MVSQGNLFSDFPTELPEELVEVLAATDGLRIERILSRGHASPEGFWYDQEKEEWVVLLKGSASLAFADGRTLALKPGDYLLIPRHERHRVVATDPEGETLWLAVHFPSVP